LFNQVIAARISEQLFDQLLSGDVVQLNGSGSIFTLDTVTPELQQRLAGRDIHLTAPLVGLGKEMVQAEAAAFEQRVLQPWQSWQQALQLLRVQAGRRSMRLLPEQLTVATDGDTVQLSFALPAGCFATSVLRELVNYRDAARDIAQMEC
jgi:tRNA pseudouridine13 synthase